MSQRVINGRFRLISVLGTGSFGQVWQAHDQTLDVEVAMKQIRLDPSATSDQRERTLDAAQAEARNAAKLRDRPNIVAVHEFIADPEGPWLVMRLVRGRTLAKEIEDRGRLPPHEARRIALGVLAALTDVHALGLVHRDVKPANIMLADDGTVLLTDFGITKPHTFVTQTTISGTPAYMAPERFAGKDLAAGDMWALGVSLFEMVEGRLPALSQGQPLSPRAFRGLILELLDMDPGKRPNVKRARSLLAAGGQDATIRLRTPGQPAGDYLRILISGFSKKLAGVKNLNTANSGRTPRPTLVAPPVKVLNIRNDTGLRQPLRVSEFPTDAAIGTVAHGDTATFEVPPTVDQITVRTVDGKRKSASQALARAVDASYPHQFVVFATRAWGSRRRYPGLLITDEGVRRPPVARRAWKRAGPIAALLAVLLVVGVGAGVWYMGFRDINNAHTGDCVEDDVTKTSHTWNLVTCAVNDDGTSGGDRYYVYKVLLRIDHTSDASLCRTRIARWNAAVDTEYVAEPLAGPAAHVLCLRPK